MEARHREQDLRIQQIGTLWDRGWNPEYIISTGSRTHGLKVDCDDVIGNKEGANPLQIYRTHTFHPALSGVYYGTPPGPDAQLEFIEGPVSYVPVPPDPQAEFPGYTTSDIHDFSWEILAKCNPAKPHVGIPQAIGELKDVPSLFKKWGTGYLDNAARLNLTWRFGIAPVINDLMKMSSFVDAVNQRIRELKSLRDRKPLRKRCSLGQYRVVKDPVHKYLHTSFYTMTGWRTVTYTAKVWGSVEWKIQPDSFIPDLNDNQIKNLARQLSTGFTNWGAVRTAWELAPWSWMIDWFSNVGTMIDALDNSLELTWNRICLMRHSRGSAKIVQESTGQSTWCTLDGWYVEEAERKERYSIFPVWPFPLPRLPILNSGQWSILASLLALQVR